MGEPAACETACDRALARHGPFNILINNIGGRRDATPIRDMPVERWRELVDLNLTSTFICTKIIGGAMVDHGQGGRVINISFALIGLLSAYLPAWRRSSHRRWRAAALASLCARAGFSGFVAIQPGHTLVTTDIYSVIRHPSYLGLLVNSLGWALVFRSGVGVLLTALTIPPLLARIRAEEVLLHTEFGGEYDAYRCRTWRLIPGLF